MDYKNTLNLPRTDFPMKADLVTREPQRLEKWRTARLYEQIQSARAGAEKFVLHDGPPFARGVDADDVEPALARVLELVRRPGDIVVVAPETPHSAWCSWSWC